jgi:acetyl-CoA C-acetyltransferase
MSDAYIYDAIRTPRGKGKKDGSLHSVKPISLLTGLMGELQSRHQLDTALVDDVVLGCVTPIGEQGADIAKIAALAAGWDWKVAGVQLNRFCASGWKRSTWPRKSALGWEDLVVAGGVESMSRVPMGSDGGAWAQDPNQPAHQLRAAGHRRRPDRHAGRLSPRTAGRLRAALAAKAAAARRRPLPLGRAGARPERRADPGRRRIHQAQHHDGGAGQPAPAFAALGPHGLRRVALRVPATAAIEHVHTAGNSSGIVDGAALALIGSRRPARASACSRARASWPPPSPAANRPSC